MLSIKMLSKSWKTWLSGATQEQFEEITNKYGHNIDHTELISYIRHNQVP